MTASSIPPEPENAPSEGASHASDRVSAPVFLRNRRARLALGIVVLLLAGGAGLAWFSGWWPRSSSLDGVPDGVVREEMPTENSATALADTAPSSAGRSFDGRLEQLERRLALAERGAVASEQAQMAAQIAALSARLDGLTQEIKILAETNETLNARLAAAEEQLAAPDDDRLVALASAVTALGHALHAGLPFENEVLMIDALAPLEFLKRAPVETLREAAKTGIRPRPALIADFAPFARQVLRADAERENANWLEKMKGHARALVSIRPVGYAQGNSTGAILARIETRLGRQDLRGAVTEAKALSGPAAKTLGPWLAQVKARLSVEETLAELNGEIIRALLHAAQDAPPAPVQPRLKG
jgi:hypothetical protein